LALDDELLKELRKIREDEKNGVKTGGNGKDCKNQ